MAAMSQALNLPRAKNMADAAKKKLYDVAQGHPPMSLKGERFQIVNGSDLCIMVSNTPFKFNLHHYTI